jgi:hypothetical protein
MLSEREKRDRKKERNRRYYLLHMYWLREAARLRNKRSRPQKAETKKRRREAETIKIDSTEPH